MYMYTHVQLKVSMCTYINVETWLTRKRYNSPHQFSKLGTQVSYSFFIHYSVVNALSSLPLLLTWLVYYAHAFHEWATFFVRPHTFKCTYTCTVYMYILMYMYMYTVQLIMPSIGRSASCTLGDFHFYI